MQSQEHHCGEEPRSRNAANHIPSPEIAVWMRAVTMTPSATARIA